MENPEIKRKLAKLHELHELENEIMKQIKEKEKLCKRISHNMKLRHVIINELEILKKEK